MSEENQELTAEQGTAEGQDFEEQFDAGFELPGYDEHTETESQPVTTPTTPQPETQLPVQPAGLLEVVPENIAEEWDNLNKLNPAAAKLALEDSPEGEAIRKRLENYGAEQAQDRAEMTLYMRNQEQATIDAHNRRFRETLQRNNPEYFSMISDPSRKAEAAKYFQDVFDWIGSKPYAEAQGLMEVAQHGRDPEQICALINRFEKEKGTANKKPDATGAYAIPSRGAPTAPTGIEDKDDFDAGWNLNQ